MFFSKKQKNITFPQNTKREFAHIRKNKKNIVSFQTRAQTFFQTLIYDKTIQYYEICFFSLVFLIGSSVFIAKYMKTCDDFLIENIKITGNQWIDSQVIIDRANIPLKKNIFSIDLRSIQNRILKHHQIKSVIIKRYLPNSIQIKIKEHIPIAITSSSYDVPSILSSEGNIIKTSKDSMFWNLPSFQIQGIDSTNSLTTLAFSILQILELLAAYRAISMEEKEPLSEIIIDKNQQMRIYIGEDGMEVNLGRDSFAPKLMRLMYVSEHLGQRRPLCIHLDNDRNPNRVVIQLPTDTYTTDTHQHSN